mmetsp:Transcript_4415/g.9233  ORF Transcript_4415/g.9233 Transcript_4415/m.9233 type:complete len:262 (+) Transcript_4415:245-1030(+)
MFFQRYHRHCKIESQRSIREFRFFFQPTTSCAVAVAVAGSDLQKGRSLACNNSLAYKKVGKQQSFKGTDDRSRSTRHNRQLVGRFTTRTSVDCLLSGGNWKFSAVHKVLDLPHSESLRENLGSGSNAHSNGLSLIEFRNRHNVFLSVAKIGFEGNSFDSFFLFDIARIDVGGDSKITCKPNQNFYGSFQKIDLLCLRVVLIHVIVTEADTVFDNSIPIFGFSTFSVYSRIYQFAWDNLRLDLDHSGPASVAFRNIIAPESG